MRPRDKTILFASSTISAILIAAALLWRLDSRRAAVPEPAPPAAQAAPETPALSRTPAPQPSESAPEGPNRNQREVTLFFLSVEGEDLAPEKRKIFLTETISDQARQAVRELIEGPRGPLRPTMPPGTEVREVYLAGDGTAYVDLSESFVDAHPGGSSAEIDTVFSLVDTLAYNFPEIRRVKILVEGEERQTLKDHLDLTRPYVADMSIVSQAEHR